MNQMTLTFFLDHVGQDASLDFEDTINLIHEHYDYQPTSFTNGCENDQIVNDAGTNEGSCKIFAFAKLHELNEARTLACFGRYYHQDVLQHPDGNDHRNIRLFMKYGWQGIQFADSPLTPKREVQVG
ncbi:HopJ type III effector protein [Pokkaliibacter plantistimulans]